MAAIKTANVLAFERKLSPSDALMFSGNWSEQSSGLPWQPINVTEKAVRGVMSNRQKKAIMDDPAKLDQETQKANLQRVDIAALPFEHDTLKVEFTLRVLGNLSTPSACDSQVYQQALQQTVQGYIDEHQFSELALRYASNIANGRFLWRNRLGAESVVVRVTAQEQDAHQSWSFDAFAFDLRRFDQATEDVAALAKVIQQGLLGVQYVLLKVEAFAKLGSGQEVFPSQELVLDSTGNSKGKKSKLLYNIGEQQIAAMHSQKIGNALRTIDDWYESAAENGPISVEPFGSVTNRGRAYRQNKMDFYSLFDKWVTKGEAPDTNQQHYAMAILIRGGVFGEKSE
ncbi:type I-F CRISPR-associated protein Csy3 [Pokkaliibacter sp. MBI-7]|uniref:type I-F CRISPR-associated protein Csy3 n=1 Tax=Pokkaliibacter sp. MBI-7 TaxID=3040600 RepID=UPI00244BB35C|nr:type I-F CRISPR-associated protein Csy3 [Pokkaliibacter sp. MBI-7]MDH2434352.1 type I-F CRISPR-associated protein Csy3 [Pokkaliibacter sp. MBI-7]